MDNMAFSRNLRIDLMTPFLVIFSDKPFDNKVEIILYITSFSKQFFFAKFSDFYNREQHLLKLCISEVNKFA